MRFHALELALSIISSLRRLLPAIRSRDPRLASQIRDAGSSIALNLGEGNRRRGGKDRPPALPRLGLPRREGRRRDPRAHRRPPGHAVEAHALSAAN